MNGTQAGFDPYEVDITASSAGVESREADDPALGKRPETTVPPGRSVTISLVYGVSDPDDMVVDVRPMARAYSFDREYVHVVVANG